MVACASQGPPQPPRVEEPKQIADLSASQRGHSIEISLTLPQETTDGEGLTKALELEIFRSETPPGDKPASPSSSAWMTLAGRELLRRTHDGKLSVTNQFSPEEFSRLEGSTLTFRARALTRGFRHRAIAGDFSRPVEVTLLRVSGPVENLEVIPHEKALELRWSPPAVSKDGPGALSGYRIYRSTTGASDCFQLLAESESTTYFDPNFEFGHTYAFKVRAAFKKGNQVAETDDSRVAPITPRDIFPPETPKNLSGLYTGTAVELIWTANTEPDLAGYNAYRREAEGQSVRLNKDLVRTPIFRDAEAEPGHKYTYRVTAVDQSNNESPPSSEVQIETR